MTDTAASSVHRSSSSGSSAPLVGVTGATGAVGGLVARALAEAGVEQRLVVRRPVEVLAGTAVPWFGQPGGGTALVLPEPAAALLAAGVLDRSPLGDGPRSPEVP